MVTGFGRMDCRGGRRLHVRPGIRRVLFSQVDFQFVELADVRVYRHPHVCGSDVELGGDQTHPPGFGRLEGECIDIGLRRVIGFLHDGNPLLAVGGDFQRKINGESFDKHFLFASSDLGPYPDFTDFLLLDQLDGQVGLVGRGIRFGAPSDRIVVDDAVDHSLRSAAVETGVGRGSTSSG